MKSGTPAFSSLSINGTLVDLRSPRVMGILNVTPDSFFEGSRFRAEPALLKQVEKMLAEGATFIDVGGYSSQPGATDIPVEEELARVTPAIRAITKEFPAAFISIDTFRAEVARQAVLEGAAIVNDIAAGALDAAMFKTVATLNVPYIAMHMRGTPQTMKGLTSYSNLLGDVTDYFTGKINALSALGVTDIVVDPGFGFAKTVEQNFELLSNLRYLQNLGRPILAGLSRKSMVWKTLEIQPTEALNGTTALNMVALMNGANILRVHDVKEAVETVKLFSHL